MRTTWVAPGTGAKLALVVAFVLEYGKWDDIMYAGRWVIENKSFWEEYRHSRTNLNLGCGDDSPEEKFLESYDVTRAVSVLDMLVDTRRVFGGRCDSARG